MKMPRVLSWKWILRRLISGPAFPIAALIPLIARLLSRWVKIRFGSMESTRIGHFSGNVELALCQLMEEKKFDSRPIVVLACIRNPIEHGSVSNRFLAKLWARKIILLPWWLLGPAISLNRRMAGLNSEFEIFNNSDRDTHNLLDQVPRSIFLSDKEVDLGWKRLALFGVPRGSKFVVVIARDRGYLLRREPHRDFSYHDYRNADINTFSSAASFLVDEGYFVIRMGRNVESPFAIENKKIIDYSCSEMQSDFMDIFLLSECAFVISTQTGVDSVAHFVFRKPTLMVNVVPVGVVLSSRVSCMAIFKRFLDADSGSELSLRDLGERNLVMETKTKDFSDQRVVLMDNTPEEILNATREFLVLLSRSGVQEPSNRQSRFIFCLESAMGERFDEYHGEFKVQIGPSFLSSSALIR